MPSKKHPVSISTCYLYLKLTDKCNFLARPHTIATLDFTLPWEPTHLLPSYVRGWFLLLWGESLIWGSCHHCASLFDCNLMMIHSYHAVDKEKGTFRRGTEPEAKYTIPIYPLTRRISPNFGRTCLGDWRSLLRESDGGMLQFGQQIYSDNLSTRIRICLWPELTFYFLCSRWYAIEYIVDKGLGTDYKSPFNWFAKFYGSHFYWLWKRSINHNIDQNMAISYFKCINLYSLSAATFFMYKCEISLAAPNWSERSVEAEGDSINAKSMDPLWVGINKQNPLFVYVADYAETRSVDFIII